MRNIIIYLLLFIFISGCEPARNLICEPQAPEDNIFDEEQIPTVETFEVTRRDAETKEVYPASIEGQKSIRIVALAEGYLQEIRVREGGHVKHGQVLFVIDQARYKTDVSAAKAQVAVAQTEVMHAEHNAESRKQLFEKKIISQHEMRVAEIGVETAKAQLALAQSQLDIALTNLAHTVIKSPSDGIVGKVPWHVGDYVSQGNTDGLTTIADTAEMTVYFSLHEREIVRRLSEHGSLDAMLASFPPVSLVQIDGTTYGHSGRVESISGIVDAKTGTLQLRATFPNPEGMLLSGASAKLVVPQRLAQVLIIPRKATFEILDKVHVYKIVDGRTKASVVRLAPLSDGQYAMVTDGLNEGDIIVANGAAFLKDDMPVQIPGDEVGEHAPENSNVNDEGDCDES